LYIIVNFSIIYYISVILIVDFCCAYPFVEQSWFEILLVSLPIMERRKDSRRSSRSCNFSLFEKDLAFSLIDAKKELLESKKTDSVALMNKKQAWADLADQFNAVTGVSKRSGPQLQCWWDKQKKRARRNIADNRVKIFATGGGPHTSSSDTWDDKVASIAASTFFPLQNDFDSDAAYQHSTVSIKL